MSKLSKSSQQAESDCFIILALLAFKNSFLDLRKPMLDIQGLWTRKMVTGKILHSLRVDTGGKITKFHYSGPYTVNKKIDEQTNTI